MPILGPDKKGKCYTSFSTASNSVEALNELTFTWNVSDPNNDSLTCTIVAEEEGFETTIDNCLSTNSTGIFIDTDPGQQIYTLKVSDTYDAITTASTAVNVVLPNIQEVSFNDPATQAAWDIVVQTPELSLLGIEFNLSEGYAWLIGNSDYQFFVPQVDQFTYMLAGVISGEPIIMFYTYDPDANTLIVTNILDMFSITINNLDTLSESDSEAVQESLLPLFLNEFVMPEGSIALATTSLQTLSCNRDCSGELSDYADKAYRTAQMSDDAIFRLVFIGAPVAGVCTFLLAGPGLLKTICGKGILSYSIYQGFRALYAHFRASTAFQEVLNCYQSNNYTYSTGSSAIAIATPPLIFSGLTFVRSLASGVNIGESGPGKTLGEVYILLQLAESEAKEQWQDVNLVTVDTTQINPNLRTINAKYYSHRNPPICQGY